jgi:hypothetical protein
VEVIAVETLVVPVERGRVVVLVVFIVSQTLEKWAERLDKLHTRLDPIWKEPQVIEQAD